ncbi:MAG: cbb3-type cytochrome oxidase assembly protein CcoS [Dokdonella sp.]
MAILLFLIPVSIILLGVAIWAFIAAVRGGQFDDLDTPPLDILRDDDADEAPRSDDRAD